MRVLLYDHNRERNNRLHRHLEDDDIIAISAHCLKELLAQIEKPSLKVLLVEEAEVQHYHLDVEALLNRLGFTFTVIVYKETNSQFNFTAYAAQSYNQFPFVTAKDRELIKKVKMSLQKLKDMAHEAEKHTHSAQVAPSGTQHAHYADGNEINGFLKFFSKNQQCLLEKFLEKRDGLSKDDIIQALHAGKSKNRQNYVQSLICRLRTKLQIVLGNKYMISYKNHMYQLLYIETP